MQINLARLHLAFLHPKSLISGYRKSRQPIGTKIKSNYRLTQRYARRDCETIMGAGLTNKESISIIFTVTARSYKRIYLPPEIVVYLLLSEQQYLISRAQTLEVI